MKAIMIRLAVLLVMAAMAVPAWAADPVGYVQTVSGEAHVVDTGGAARAAAVDMAIMPEETLRTGMGGQMQVMFIDRSILAMGEDSEIAVLDAYSPDGEGSLAMRFFRGTARVLTSEILSRNPEAFTMETPLGLIGIRGTEFGLFLDGEREVVGLFEGGPVLYTDTQAMAQGGGDACQALAEALEEARKAYRLMRNDANFYESRRLQRAIRQLEQRQRELGCVPAAQ